MAGALRETRANNRADEDEDWADWQQIGGDAGTTHRGLTLDRVKMMRDKARQLARDNPHAKGLLDNFVKYVVGKGFQYVVQTEDETLAVKATERWEEFCKSTKWERKEREIVRRALRDGEVFIRFFKKSGGLALRFIDPALIVPKAGDTKNPFGIEYKPDDRGGPPVAYYVRKSYSATTVDRVDAKEIQHIKVEVDEDVPRGISILWVVRQRLRQYDTWLGDRLILNKLRTAIVLLRQHKGASPAQIKAFADAEQTETKTDPVTGQSYRSKRVQPGSIIDVPASVDMKYLSANINARDAAVDGRTVLLSVAAGIGQPEYMVTGDASNANYASTMVAEGPGVRQFELWQSFFGNEFALIWRRVMEWTGQVQADVGGVDKCDVGVVGQRIVTRKPKEEAETHQILADNQILSKRTWAAREGLDYEEEQRNLEAEESVGAGGPVMHGQGGGEDEEGEDEEAALAASRRGVELPVA